MHTSTRHSIAASTLSAAAGALFVASIWWPVARTGVGSALAVHELFDLLLADTLPLGIPRWLGILGYLPALGGATLLMAEALVGRSRLVTRAVGYAVAALSTVALVTQGPWSAVETLGTGAWLALAATVTGGVAWIILLAERTGSRRRSRVTVPTGDPPTGTPTLATHVGRDDHQMTTTTALATFAGVGNDTWERHVL